MMLNQTHKNPFIYSTPDQIKDPQEALDLFVEVFKDFYLIESRGNTFVHGVRGSGKSMMFRIMRPDCQKIRLEKPLKELDYYAIYVPVKETSLNLQDIQLLAQKHGEFILNEHLMCIYFSICIFNFLSQEDYEAYEEYRPEVKAFYKKLIHIFKRIDVTLDDCGECCINDIFTKVVDALEDIQNEFTVYLSRLALGADSLLYSGPLCLFRNFLYPIVKDLVKLSFLPDAPMYFLVDDADALSDTQTQILNTWVSFRTTSDICFKITTQLNYKTYYTSSGQSRIDSPHDYHEVNLSDIYTSDPRTTYRENVKKIVERRLDKIYNLQLSAEEFFPSDTVQEAKVRKIEQEYTSKVNYDFAYRNARVDYMLSLHNEYTYSYAGFDQLVHLSSGIIRNFIDLAFKMFDQTQRVKNDDQKISFIPVSIQNQEIKDYSTWLLQQLDKSIDSSKIPKSIQNDYQRLKILLDSIGKAFRVFLESNSSERKKFSFYFDGEIKPELKSVLKLGVSEGLLHYSTHGSKRGLGRSHKYVFNRMLSPIYKLDPFTFSGYLYVTQSNLELAFTNPDKFVRGIRKRANGKEEEELSQYEIDF